MINHELPRNYVCPLEDEELATFVQAYKMGESWPKLRELTGLSKYQLENIVMYYNLGDKTSYYKRKVEGPVANGLRTEKGELYLNNVHPSHIADEYRDIYKIGEDK